MSGWQNRERVGDAVIANDGRGFWSGVLGDAIGRHGFSREDALCGMQAELMRIESGLPSPPAVPLPGWLKRIGLPTGPRLP